MKSNPRLNWKESRISGEQIAHAGHLTLRADERGGWSVDAHGVDLAIGAEVAIPTLEAARLEAERQAIRIGAAMLTPFADLEADSDVIADPDDTSSWMDVEEYAATNPDDAGTLALALLLAVEKRREATS